MVNSYYLLWYSYYYICLSSATISNNRITELLYVAWGYKEINSHSKGAVHAIVVA